MELKKCFDKKTVVMLIIIVALISACYLLYSEKNPDCKELTFRHNETASLTVCLEGDEVQMVALAYDSGRINMLNFLKQTGKLKEE